MIEFGLTEPALTKEQEEAGLHPILPRFQHFDNYQLLCNEPVDSLESAAGKRVRVGNDTYAKEAENLGMIPVALSGAEIYEGFERGIVDCFMGGEVDMLGLGLSDLGKNYTAANLPGWNSVSIDVGADFWNELSEEQKTSFNAGIPTFLETLFSEYINTQHEFFSKGASTGINFLEPDAEMQDTMDEHHEAVIAELVAEAPATIPDPRASVERFSELQKKWVGIVEELGYDQGVATKAEWVEKYPDTPNVDLKPWIDALNEEVLDEHRPTS
jgi:TRAP-type C4-dicarboxylate transport system substrate-binding protein